MWRSASLLDSDTQLNQCSYYEASVQRPATLPALQENLQVDVVVVGAGFAGLSAALDLAQQGLSVVVLEADRVGSGASGRNGGQAIVGFASGQSPFQEQLGAVDAQCAWELSVQAVDLLQERMQEHHIDCDWVPGYVYAADSPRKAKALRLEALGLEHQGLSVDWAQGDDVRRHIASPRYCAAFREERSGHLHPLKYAMGLARAAQDAGVRLFEGSPVTALDRGDEVCAHTAHGQVRARFAVLAGNCLLPVHGPAVAPEIAPRIMPVGTYMVATPPLEAAQCRRLIPSNAAVCDNNFVLDYFRFSADHRLLFGGQVSYTTMTPAGLSGLMQRRMARVFPELKQVPAEFTWGGFVDISMNRAPDFGRLGYNIYYLQGFSGHGVALTGMAGRLVSQAITLQGGHFDVLARLQHRSFPGGPLLRTPTLALGMLWHRLRDYLS